MIEKLTNNRNLAIGIHILIGFLATFSFFPKIYTLFVIISCIMLLYSSKNENEEALILAFYITGAEVFIRMTGGILLYETGKYSMILILFLGYFIGRKKNKTSVFFILYFLLLLLGIVFTKVPEGESIRKAILFNLSGPFSLGIAALYFFKREVTKKRLLNSLYFGILPIISMIVYMYFRTPNLREIVFGGAANFQASGGFGPNQVATAIGLGIFILTVFLLQKIRLTHFLWLDIILLFYLFYRGLLTFSRGGILTGIIAIICFAFFYTLSKRDKHKLIFKYFVITAIFGISVWVYASDVTGGMINNRYTNKSASGVKKEDISTGRLDILTTQFQNFIDKPLGIGVGNGKYQRIHSGKNVTAASHNEMGRLIEEHGFIGFIILLGLIITPFITSINQDNQSKAFLFSFFLLWFLTINHSAMRIALPGFIYGLSLIKITETDDG